MLKIAECRPEVQAFAVAMEEKLRANDHKGGWKGCCPLWLFQRAEDELEGLRAEMPYHPARPGWLPTRAVCRIPPFGWVPR